MYKIRRRIKPTMRFFDEHFGEEEKRTYQLHLVLLHGQSDKMEPRRRRRHRDVEYHF
jgi:hypothetical protein